ncbi:MAG: hypothetical protein ABFS12_07880 [Bacteroidota bacterium]
MGKVIFSIRYEVLEDKLEDYFDVIRELQNVVKAEGLEAYKVYKVKSKKNQYEEVYSFESEEAYDSFDDDPDERVDILMNKLSDIIKPHTTKYVTLNEI